MSIQTAPRCSHLRRRCMRQMLNINSFMMHKRDEYNSRHKPFEPPIYRNKKQRIQLRNISKWSRCYGSIADEQPDKEKILWKRHLSPQADYRAEIHELHTELLNMRERSEMKAHLAANMFRIEQTVPSRTVDAEPDNTLNTLSPGRSSRWILPHELETPDRPTSSGLQSPVGVPVQFGPSPYDT